MAAARNHSARRGHLYPHRLPVVLALLGIAASAHATATPTRAPEPFSLDGIVARAGMQPPADVVMVTGRVCSFRPNCLEPQSAGVSSSSGDAGMFSLTFPDRASTTIVVSAVVDGVVLRGLETGSRFVTVDPISEAAVRLIEGAGLQNYDCPMVSAILSTVRDSNAATDFSGLDVEAAVEAAAAAAMQDAVVQMALATVTPTPTRTASRTATPTATQTLGATSTPAACVGDCNADGSVTVDELVRAVDLALGGSAAQACTAYYSTSTPVISDIIVAVNNALETCAPLAAAPDLVASRVRVIQPPVCRGQALIDVCVANVGQTAAGRFRVTIDPGDTFEVAGLNDLPAGAEECTIRGFSHAEVSVQVDVDNNVAEGRENNNAITFMLPTPLPPPPCTPTATATVVE